VNDLTNNGLQQTVDYLEHCLPLEVHSWHCFEVRADVLSQTWAREGVMKRAFGQTHQHIAHARWLMRRSPSLNKQFAQNQGGKWHD